MQTAKWPQRKCREHVAGPYGQMGLCEIPENNSGEGHAGPCATYTIPHSVREREAWEEAHPDEL